MASKATSLKALAQQISTLTEQVATYISENSLPDPTFGPAYDGIPEEAKFKELQAPLLQAIADLQLLIQGPKMFIRSFGCSFFDIAAFQVALEFGFFKKIPLDGSITLSELAKAAGIAEDITGSTLRLLATQRIFAETKKDVFEHTTVSATLAKDDDITAAIHMEIDDQFKAASDIDIALRRESHHFGHKAAPFYVRHGDVAYSWYTKNPDKGARFAQAMTGFAKLERPFTELRDDYDWASLGRGKVVDVGGGNGSISMMLAKEFPDLDFIVQDISEDMMKQAAKRKELQGLEGRVTFMQHDFFKPQPIHDARAYFFRHITHNYIDDDVLQILRALVPALEKNPEAVVLVNDSILPELDVKYKCEERIARQSDFAMFVILGCKQRTAAEFQALFKRADSRFEITKTYGGAQHIGLMEMRLIQSGCRN